MKKLHKHIFRHTTGDGLNIGCVVGDDGPVSIDLPMSAEEALAWRAQVGQVTDKPLRAVVFTSPGRVSSDALAAIAPQPGALSIPAVIQDAGFAQLYAALEASQPRALEPLTPAQLRERAVLPDVTFSDSMTIVVATSAGPLSVDIAALEGMRPAARTSSSAIRGSPLRARR